MSTFGFALAGFCAIFFWLILVYNVGYDIGVHHRAHFAQASMRRVAGAVRAGETSGLPELLAPYLRAGVPGMKAVKDLFSLDNLQFTVAARGGWLPRPRLDSPRAAGRLHVTLGRASLLLYPLLGGLSGIWFSSLLQFGVDSTAVAMTCGMSGMAFVLALGSLAAQNGTLLAQHATHMYFAEITEAYGRWHQVDLRATSEARSGERE